MTQRPPTGATVERTAARSGYPPEVVNRLKTARGHLDGILRMVDDDAYCPDVMKQIAAVQGVLETAARLVLRKHLRTCVADGIRAGAVDQVIDELMDALKFDKSLTTRPDARERG